MLDSAPVVQSMLVGRGWNRSRSSRFFSKPAAAQDHAALGPDDALDSLAEHRDARDAAVLDDEVAQLGAVLHGHARVDEALAESDREGVAHRVHLLAAQAADDAVEHDLEHRDRAADGAHSQADLAEVGLRDDQVRRRLGVRRVQVDQLVAEEAAVHRHRLDASPPGPSAGRLGQVVGVLRDPGEPDRRVLAHEVHDLWPTVDEGVPADLGHHVADDRLEVALGLLRVVGLTGRAQRVVAGDPDATAGARRRPAEVVALLDEQGVEPLSRGGEGGGHAGTTGTDDDHVVGGLHGAKL